MPWSMLSRASPCEVANAVICSSAAKPLAANALEQHVDALVDERQLDLGGAPRLEQAAKQPRSGATQREQLGPQDVALAHVDDVVRLLGVETDDRALARP